MVISARRRSLGVFRCYHDSPAAALDADLTTLVRPAFHAVRREVGTRHLGSDLGTAGSDTPASRQLVAYRPSHVRSVLAVC